MGQKHGKLTSYGGKKKTKAFRKWELKVLKRTFRDLASRLPPDDTLCKETFLSFFHTLQGLVGERLFAVFHSPREHEEGKSKTSSNEIDLVQWLDGLSTFCRGEPLEKARFVFRMFDLAGTGKVSRADLKSMLTSLMLAAETLNPVLNRQVRSHSITTQDDIKSTEIKLMIDSAMLLGGYEADSPISANQAIGLFGFAKWLQKYPNVVEVLDNAFVGHYTQASLIQPPASAVSSSSNDSSEADSSRSSSSLPSSSSSTVTSTSTSGTISRTSTEGDPYNVMSILTPQNTREIGAMGFYHASDEDATGESSDEYEYGTTSFDSTHGSRTTSRDESKLNVTADLDISRDFDSDPDEKHSNHAAKNEPVLSENKIGTDKHPMDSMILQASDDFQDPSEHLTGHIFPSSSSASRATSRSEDVQRQNYNPTEKAVPPGFEQTNEQDKIPPRRRGSGIIVINGSSDSGQLAHLEIKCNHCQQGFIVKHCYKCGQRLTHLPSNLECNDCGTIIVGNLIRFCFCCGKDLRLGNLFAEPTLFRNTAFDTQSEQYSGWLYKVGQRLGHLSKRWYVIRDSMLYCYRKQHAIKPSSILYMQGCYIEAVNHEEKGHKRKFGIEIIISEAPRKSRFLFSKTASDRLAWIQALKYAADTHNVDSFYVIGKEVGVGRFSSVRECTSRTTGRKYAIKTIDKTNLDEKAREALRTEVAVLKLVSHPNIISLKNVFDTRRQLHLVMTFVSGGDLFSKLQELKRFSEALTQRVIYQLLTVVQYLHVRGIVHRDLKPENIMIRYHNDEHESDYFDIFLGDFGLSKFATSSMNQACGTPSYVAPEVLAMNGYGKEVDLWSVGVIMFFLLRGQLPFRDVVETLLESSDISQPGGSFFEQYRNIPFDDNIWNAEISDHARDQISRLLQIDPNQRSSVTEALAHPWIQIEFKNGVSEMLKLSKDKQLKIERERVQKKKTPQISRKGLAVFTSSACTALPIRSNNVTLSPVLESSSLVDTVEATGNTYVQSPIASSSSLPQSSGETKKRKPPVPPRALHPNYLRRQSEIQWSVSQGVLAKRISRKETSIGKETSAGKTARLNSSVLPAVSSSSQGQHVSAVQIVYCEEGSDGSESESDQDESYVEEQNV